MCIIKEIEREILSNRLSSSFQSHTHTHTHTLTHIIDNTLHRDFLKINFICAIYKLKLLFSFFTFKIYLHELSVCV